MRNLRPFLVEMYLLQNYRVTRKDISSCKTGYIIKLITTQQYNQLKDTNHILESPCKILEESVVLKAYNTTKVVIYLKRDYSESLESFEEGLKQRYNICEVTMAHWIRSRNESTKAYMITSAQSRIPTCIYIPGEAMARVNPYVSRPLICNKCFDYGHPQKNCKNEPRCTKCGEHHSVDSCGRAILECLHCGEKYRPGAQECRKQRQEEAILKLQYQQKISIAMALQKYIAESGDKKRKYAELLSYSRTRVLTRP